MLDRSGPKGSFLEPRMSSVTLFRVRSPMLVVDKKSAHLEKIQPGAIVALNDEERYGPGLREIKLDGRDLLAFNRDLEERTERLESKPHLEMRHDRHRKA